MRACMVAFASVLALCTAPALDAAMETWEWHRARAFVAYQDGHSGEVGAHLERALATARGVPGADEEVATSLNDLAEWAQYRGEYEAAERLLGESLAIRERLFPDGDVDLARSLTSLAHLCIMLGRHAAARPLLNRSRRMATAAGGIGHTQVIRAEIEFARLHIAEGDLAMAEFILLNARPPERASHQDDGNVFGADLGSYSLYYLGLVYRLQGRLDDAIALQQRAIDYLARLYGRRHVAIATHLCEAARAELGRGDVVLADQLVATATEIQAESLDDANPERARCELTKATIRLAQGRADDARRIAGHTLAALALVFDPGHPLLEESRAVLANAQ